MSSRARDRPLRTDRALAVGEDHDPELAARRHDPVLDLVWAIGIVASRVDKPDECRQPLGGGEMRLDCAPQAAVVGSGLVEAPCLTEIIGSALAPALGVR